MKKLVWAAFAVIVLMVGAFAGLIYVLSQPQTPSRLVITNAASAAIVSGTVGLCGQVFSVKPIPPVQSMAIVHGVDRDCHYDLDLTFEGGKSLKTSFGYVTHGAIQNLHYDVTEEAATYRK